MRWKRSPPNGKTSCGTELFFERFAQEGPRTKQSRLDGLGAQSEQLGGLLDAHLFDKPGDEHRSEGFRQLVNRPLDDIADLVARHTAFRVTR